MAHHARGKSSSTAIILNPAAAGGAAGRRWPRLEARLREAGVEAEIVRTVLPGQARQLAAEFAEAGFDLVVAAGGDGTVNEVVNGLLGDPLAAEPAFAPTLGILPLGRGSDLVRSLRGAWDQEAAARRLAAFDRVLVDVGLATFGSPGAESARWFVNAAGVGFDGLVAEQAARASGRRGGTLPYLRAVVASIRHFVPYACVATVDGESSALDLTTLVVANGRYFGGGMRVAPDAEITDGHLDLVVIGALSRAELLVQLPRIYLGAHLSHPRVHTRRAQVVAVQCLGAPVETDGDVAGYSPVRFSVVPARLAVAV